MRPARADEPHCWRAHRALAAAGRLAAGLLAAGLLAAPRGADLVWTDDDWSQGRYALTSAADPEVHPGLLIPANDPATMLFVAEPTDYRGIYAMAVYHDTLFLGAGPYPITADGADVLSYDYRTGVFRTEYQPDEQGITALKVFGDTLYMPGPETHDGYTLGSAIYLYNGHEWIKKQHVQLALHLFDLEMLDGAIYVTTGDHDYIGSVRVSHDLGETWDTLLHLDPTSTSEGRRFYGIGSFQGRIYAQPDGYEPESECIYAFDGTAWDTIPMPGLPEAKMGKFTAWGDSLFLNIRNRMYILHEGQVHASWMPFAGDRWCQGFHVYKGMFYGGADYGRLYRWSPGSPWSQIGEIGLDPSTEEISVLATYYGRLYLATARYEGHTGGRLYVSAAAPQARLLSLVHDFGAPTVNGTLAWIDFRPGSGNTTRFRVRSGATPEDLAAAPFLGPDGTATSSYVTSGTALPAAHRTHRYFQYQVDLLCPAGLEMPFVDRVTLAVDTLDATSVDEPPAASAPRLWLGAPRPNPARHGVELPVAPAAAGAPAERALWLRVTDLQGRRVREERVALHGTERTLWRWDLTDCSGARVPAGIYLVRVSCAARTAAGAVATRTLLVLR